MLTVKIDDKDLRAAMAKMEAFSQRRMNATIATAISRTAVITRDAVKAELLRATPTATEYTQRGIFIRTASAAKLEARIWYNDEFKGSNIPQGRYLYPQIAGGTRAQKRFEKALMAKGSMPAGHFAVPGPAAKLDGRGNVSRGQIVQMLSQVGTELTAGSSRTLKRRPGETDKQFATRKRRAFGKAGGQYVAITKQRGKLRPGIYIAGARDFGAKLGLGRTGKLRAMFYFVRSVKYTPRFRFYETAQAIATANMGPQLDRAINESAARMAASGTQQSFGGF